MALFKSQLVTQISGSVGGTTYAHNKGGMYMRARSLPTNPDTTQQSTVRSIMSDLVNLWGSTLTAAQRTAWETYASNTPVINKLGDSVTLTGLNMYVRGNLPRLQAALARIDAGPITFNLGAFTPLTIDTSVASGLAVNFTSTDAWANETGSSLLVWNGLNQAPTVNYFTGPFRFAGKIDGDGTTAPTSPAVLTAAYLLVLGNHCFMRARVSFADGRLSPVQKLVDVTAA